MNAFLIGLVERATLRAPVLERRARSLFEPIAPSPAGVAAIEGDEQAVPGERDEHLASASGDESAGRAPREPTLGGEPVERWQHSETSPAAGAPRRNGRSGDVWSHALRAAEDEPRPMFAALDRVPLDPERKSDAASVAVSIALTSPAETEDPRGQHGAPAWSPGRRADDGPRPVPVASIPDRDREPTARPAPLLATAPRGRAQRDRGAEPGMLSTGRLQLHASALDGDASLRVPRAPGVRAASADLAADAPAPAASGGAPATNAPLLRSGPRVPGPPAALVQSQRPAGLSQLGGTAAAAAPPPVHVTIGRLEVRANAPAAERPPARPSSVGPKLTLDDYLYGRRGGSR